MENSLLKSKLERNDKFEELYIISNSFKKVKEKKNWFNNEIKKYMLELSKGLDSMERDKRFATFRKKLTLNSFSHKKNPVIKKRNLGLTLNKGNNYSKYFNKGKFIANRTISKSPNNTFNTSKNNMSAIANNSNDYKSKTVNKIITNKSIIKVQKKNNESKNEDSKINDSKINESKNDSKCYINLKFNSNILPNIPGSENRKIYFKKKIFNIWEKIGLLGKKLAKEENKKYYGFKSKYNRLYNKSQKIEININQYTTPKYKNKFILHSKDENLGNLKKVMKQITYKLKNKDSDKLGIYDIIDEVEKYKINEKLFKDRIQKRHEKLKYLVNDSNIIKKRIDIKYQQINSN